MAEQCPHPSCGLDIEPHWDRCQHCSRSLEFPNVRAATAAAERDALDARYQSAVAGARTRGAAEVLAEFERRTSHSRAVVCREKDQIDVIFGSGVMLTYQKQVRAGLRPPDTDKWAWLRADESRWFAGYTDEIHYAALSLDERGASGWGPVVLVLSDRMIAHRATVGETNVVTFAERLAREQSVPPGHRARWNERAKLCVAKLHAQVRPDTAPDAFAGILHHITGDRRTDDFVEVHIYGSLTTQSVERVRIPKAREKEFADKAADLRRKGVDVEFID